MHHLPYLIMADTGQNVDEINEQILVHLSHQFNCPATQGRSFVTEQYWIEVLRNDIRDEQLKLGEDGYIYYATEIAITPLKGAVEEIGTQIVKKVIFEVERLGYKCEFLDE